MVSDSWQVPVNCSCSLLPLLTANICVTFMIHRALSHTFSHLYTEWIFKCYMGALFIGSRGCSLLGTCIACVHSVAICRVPSCQCLVT